MSGLEPGEMTSDTSLQSDDHPWPYDLLSTESTSPYPTLSPYDDFASLRATNRSPPPTQEDVSRPGTPRPRSSTSHGNDLSFPRPYSQRFGKRPISGRPDALGIEIPSLPRLSPRPPFDTPRRLLLPRPLFARTNLSPLSAHSSPSLSSSVATAPSTPDSPCWQQDSLYNEEWPLISTQPIRTKRRFSNIRHAKRLPHNIEPPWQVHALIEVCESPLPSDSIAKVRDQWRQQQRAESNTAGHFSDDRQNLEEDLHEQHVRSSKYVHYRGASFEVINPRRSLLLGKSLIETPAAEIDLLIDDYLNSVDTMSESPSIEDSTPTRQLYTDPEQARRAILRLSRHDQLASQAAQAQAYEQGASAISAIIAGYDHTTPTNIAQRHPHLSADAESVIEHASTPVSEASDAGWLEFARNARQASPGLPFHAALAKAYAETPQRSQETGLTPAATAHGGISDPATTDRTYGDTNRLLQLTPQTGRTVIGPVDTAQMPSAPVESPHQAERPAMPRLRRVTTSVGTIIHNLVDRTPSHALSSYDDSNVPDTRSATFYNPFDIVEYEREDENDPDEDWETEQLGSEVEQGSAGEGAPSARSPAAFVFDDFEFDHTIDSIPQTDGDRDSARYPASGDDVEGVLSHISTLYSSKLGAMRSDETLRSTAQASHIREAQQSIDRARRESPHIFQQAVNNFLQNHGQATSDELNRVWTRNNGGRQARVSDSSFDHVIRQARLAEEKERIERYPDAVVAHHNLTAHQRGLFYSPTADTFATARPPVQRPFIERFLRPEHVLITPQPIDRSETDLADVRLGDRRAVPRPGLRSMASMSSQTGLRDLHLTSTPTSDIGFVAAREVPFRDIERMLSHPVHPPPPPPAQLWASRPPGPQPDYSPERSRRNIRVTPMHEQRYVQLDNLDRAGRLIRPPQLHRRALDPVGTMIFKRHHWNPVICFILWAGRYDKQVAEETGGEYKAVSSETKLLALKWALCVCFGVVVILAIVGVFTALGVFMNGHTNSNGRPKGH